MTAVRRHRVRRWHSGAVESNTALGFLDVNTGVLGLFLLIFAIRIILVQLEAGRTADLVIRLEDQQGLAALQWFGPEPDQRGELQYFDGDASEEVVDLLRRFSDGTPEALLIDVYVTADARWSDRGLRDLLVFGSASADGLPPHLIAWRPLASDVDFDATIDTWREARARNLPVRAAPNEE